MAVNGSKQEKWFVCVNCGRKVYYNQKMTTKNRNHCNGCLWSRHVDKKVGDRTAQCRMGMEPIGLTLMNKGMDKYGQPKKGEIMLVHRCVGCDKISINRIAADDSEEKLWEVFGNSGKIDKKILQGLRGDNICLLDRKDSKEVRRQLFGES